MARPLVIAERVHAHRERHGGRKRRRNTLIVLHTTEGGEGANAAEALASACTRPGDRPKEDGSGMFGSSYHWVVDTDRVIPIVPEDVVAFSARGANDDGIHIVFPGRASQSRQAWLDPVSSAYIDECALLMVDINRRTGIPLVPLDVRQVQARHSGYIDHGIVSDAFGLTDHTDVGDGFPWDVLAQRIAAMAGDADRDEPGVPGRSATDPSRGRPPADREPGGPDGSNDAGRFSDMLPIITNKQPLGRVGPSVIKWALMDDGSLRALDPGEWEARGSLPGVAWDNDQLRLHGVEVDTIHR